MTSNRDLQCRERYTFLTKSKATKPKPKPRGKRHKEGRDKVGDVMVQALDKDLPGLPGRPFIFLSSEDSHYIVEEPPSVAPSRPRPRPRARRVSEVRETTVDEVGDQSPKEHSGQSIFPLSRCDDEPESSCWGEHLDERLFKPCRKVPTEYY